MSKYLRYIIPAFIVLITIMLFTKFAPNDNYDVLNPAGIIAAQQKDLLVFATLLMMLIVIPVFALTFYIPWKYRASNKQAKYQPNWDSNRKLEMLWWGFPCAIILVLAIVTWNSSHSLDPYRAIQSDQKPLKIQVIALQWKWLFLYPQEQIATLNYVQLPVNRPVDFEITADAPMNSFWIPKLGGQIYAMSGMSTHLNLMATRTGTFQGSSANLSGSGFAAMRFTAESTANVDFENWVQTTRQNSGNLSLEAYSKLSQPNISKSTVHFSSYDPALYDKVIMKYMGSASHGITNTTLYEQNSANPENIGAHSTGDMKHE